MTETTYTAKDITVLEGLEPVRLRPGHVHRLDGPARPPSPGLRGGRQLGRRGPRGTQRPHRDHPPSGRLGDRPRLRLGHPRGRHGRAGPARADGRPDEAPRGRQVRRRRLQGLRRPARRRRLGRERALRVARRRGASRREDLPPGVRARRARRASIEVVGKTARATRARSITFLPGRRDLRGDRVVGRRRSSSASARPRS